MIYYLSSDNFEWFGLLSLFPIKDLDFDFYASEYLNFPEIDLYQHYYIPNEVFLLESGIDYRVINGSISVTDGVSSVTYSENSSFSVTALSKYSIISGEPIVTFHSDLSSLGSSLVYPILDENKELKKTILLFFKLLKSEKLSCPKHTSNSKTAEISLK